MALPLFWVDTIGLAVKGAVCSGWLSLSVCNFARGFRQFESKWTEEGQIAFDRNFDPKTSAIDWPLVLKRLGLKMEIYLPGLPRQVTPYVSALILVFILAGLSLRNSFPVFSLFARAVPMLILASWCLQIVGAGVAQSLRIKDIERSKGINILQL